MTQASLKFLTLNCWGLPFFTPSRKRRFRAITAILKKNDWDVVALQEVWLKSDRQWLIQNSGFAFHAVFDDHRPWIGPGLLLLSKYKIIKSDFHQFVARGLPHKIHEFDFHSAKGIGFALIDSPLGEVPVFLTHLIAKYVKRSVFDENHLFRLAQILEIVSYAQKMASPRGFVLCGDLNSSESDLEMDALSSFIGLKKSLHRLKSPKKRLDYVLCGASDASLDFKITRSSFVLKNNIENHMIPYSDHHGVSAVIRATAEKVNLANNKRVLFKTLRYLKHLLHRARRRQRKLSWIPIFGWLTNYFLQPQLTYVDSLIRHLEKDLKTDAQPKLKGAS